MLKKHSLILLIALVFGCDTFKKDSKSNVIGKWTLVEPIELNHLISITQMNCELTEKRNAFKKITITINGINTEADEVGKYEMDGNRIIWDNGTVFILSEDGQLTTEQTLPSMPHKKFIVRLRKM